MNLRVIFLGAAVAVLLTGCGGPAGPGEPTPSPEVGYGPLTVDPAAGVSAACAAAAEKATRDLETAAASDLVEVAEAAADEDGEVTDLELVAIDDAIAQYETQLRDAVAETFTSCTNAAEWIAVAQQYPVLAESTEADAVSDWALQAQCPDFVDTPVCVDAAKQGIVIESPPPVTS